MIARLHVGNSLTNRLDVTGTLMTKDNGESTLGVLARECVCIGMADTSVVDLDTNFVCARGQNLNFLNGEVLASFPGYCGLLLHLSALLFFFPSTATPPPAFMGLWVWGSSLLLR